MYPDDSGELCQSVSPSADNTRDIPLIVHGRRVDVLVYLTAMMNIVMGQ